MGVRIGGLLVGHDDTVKHYFSREIPYLFCASLKNKNRFILKVQTREIA